MGSHHLLLIPLSGGQMLGDITSSMCLCLVPQAGPYLGPAADEQVQHVLTDLVIVFIQKLVNLAKGKTLR